MADDCEIPKRWTFGKNASSMSYPYPATPTGRSMAQNIKLPNTMVRRRAKVRHILNTRAGRDGIHSYKELREVLAQEGFPAGEMTVRSDLAALGAVKIQDEEVPSLSWWVVPAWNPAAESLRGHLDPEVIEHEVFVKMAAHVMQMVVVGSSVHIMTEPRAGYMVAYWLSWLEWPGIINVQEQLDACIIYCASVEDAMVVQQRLLGEGGVPDDDSEDGTVPT